MQALIVLAGTVPVFANGVGFVAAVMQNFALNRYFTFPESRDQAASRQIVKFFLVSLVGLALNLPVFMFVDLTVSYYFQIDWGYRLAKLCAIGVVLIWNYYANRTWTFQSREAI